MGQNLSIASVISNKVVAPDAETSKTRPICIDGYFQRNFPERKLYPEGNCLLLREISSYVVKLGRSYE